MKFTISRHPDSLCETCDYLMRVRDGNGAIVINNCSVGSSSTRVPLVVRECTSYSFKFSSAPHEMRMIGWVLERKGIEIKGFRPPKTRDEGPDA